MAGSWDAQPAVHVTMADSSAACAPLSPRQRRALVAFFALVVLFGGVVEMRSAFLQRRMTDLDVYLRAAWAVRTGADIYSVTDDNGWHYFYPPLPAVLLVPLADPPQGVDRAGTLPFSVSVMIWYWLNVAALAFGTHRLVSALEATSTDSRLRRLPRGCRRWWALRIVPVLICLLPIGHSLSRGQVNLIVLALLCSAIAAAMRGHNLRAGVWLAAAISVKVIPAFLLAYPLWRRDLRWLAGAGVGLTIGLIAVPAAVLGPSQTLAYARQWFEVVARPGLTSASDGSRPELLNVALTDSQSFAAVLHNTMHAHLPRDHRPSEPTPMARVAHWVIGGALTLLTLAVGHRRHGDTPVVALIRWGALMILMVLLSPVCWRHYFALALPLIAGLLALDIEQGRHLAFRVAAGLFVSTYFLLLLPGFEFLRQFGPMTYSALLLWVVGLARLRTQTAPHHTMTLVNSPGTRMVRR